MSFNSATNPLVPTLLAAMQCGRSLTMLDVMALCKDKPHGTLLQSYRTAWKKGAILAALETCLSDGVVEQCLGGDEPRYRLSRSGRSGVLELKPASGNRVGYALLDA